MEDDREWNIYSAGGILLLIEAFFFGVMIYIVEYFAGDFVNDKIIIYGGSLIILITNYYLLFNKGKPERFVREFDALPKKINRKGSWIAAAIIILSYCIIFTIIIYMANK